MANFSRVTPASLLEFGMTVYRMDAIPNAQLIMYKHRRVKEIYNFHYLLRCSFIMVVVFVGIPNHFAKG